MWTPIANLDLLKELQESVPNNEFGLPVGFYRIDLLQEDSLSPQALEQQESLKNQGIHPDQTAEAPPSKYQREGKPIGAGLLSEADLPEVDPDDYDYDYEGYESLPYEDRAVPTVKRAGKSLLANALADDSTLEPAEHRNVIPLNREIAHPEAFVRLGYAQGYPEQPGGSPFWEKLDHESPAAFFLFQRYLSSFPRFLPDMVSGSVGLQQLKEYSEIYHWSVRARSYDMFQEATAQRLQAHRALTTTDKHYQAAEKLFTKVMAILDSEDDEDREFLRTMAPRDLIKLMQMVVEMQRISAGLPAHGPRTTDQEGREPMGSEMEVTLRRLARRMPNEKVIGDDMGGGLAELLSDPQSAEMAQELVFRMTKTMRQP